jgi:Kef-type K+ transport system membrane component KefB
MTTNILATLVIVLAVAAAAPLICAALRRWLNIPVVVMEMLLGIIVGPSLLGIATSNPIMAGLAAIGVWLLFFGAGYETDFAAVKDRMKIASFAWLICLALAIGAGYIIALFLPPTQTSPFASAVFIGGALVSTGLGTILPMMRDANQIDTRIGKAIISSGVVGQFAPQIAIGILVGIYSPLPALGLHALFFGVVGGLIWLADRYGMPAFSARVQTATLDTGAQWGIIFQIALCCAMVLIGEVLGVDRAIGAFAAGLLARHVLYRTESEEHHVIDRKMKAVAYGLFLPIFFINAGLTFDLRGLIVQPAAFALIPIFFLLKLLIRGVPGSATLERPASWRERVSVSMLVGTGLAAVILMSNIGLERGAISSTTASALIGAAKLTALIFPTIALNLASRDPANQPVPLDYIPA